MPRALVEDVAERKEAGEAGEAADAVTFAPVETELVSIVANRAASDAKRVLSPFHAGTPHQAPPAVTMFHRMALRCCRIPLTTVTIPALRSGTMLRPQQHDEQRP